MLWVCPGTVKSFKKSKPEKNEGKKEAIGEKKQKSEAKMIEEKFVKLTSNSVYVQGTPRILRVGSVQWFRLPESDWEDILHRFYMAGFNTVDVYVPWRDVEPDGPGKFSKRTIKSLTRFLEAVKRKGLFAYFRPGPYICDEFDGGGLPAWLLKESRERDDDGQDDKAILRTACPNWLRHVRCYLDHLNREIKPYLITNTKDPGPIILYAIENEYDHFEKAFTAEKVFVTSQRQGERGMFQSTHTKEYFSSLRDIVRRHINVPITTCPGQPKIAGTGDVSDIWPLPNHWSTDGHEMHTFALRKEMHDLSKHDGAYADMPVGMSEGPALATSVKRQILAGMRVVSAFNAVGFHTYGYKNAIDVDPETMGISLAGMSNLGKKALSAFSWSNSDASKLFFHPRVGYMSGAIDFYGPISHSGNLREKFYSFRRANVFFSTYESRIATATPGFSHIYYSLGCVNTPQCSLFPPFLTCTGRQGPPPTTQTSGETTVTLTSNNGLIGARDSFGRRIVNWLEAEDGTLFISILNNSTRSQYLSRCSVHVSDGATISESSDTGKGRLGSSKKKEGIEEGDEVISGNSFPRFSLLHVPVETYPGSRKDIEQLRYNALLVARMPLTPNLTLRYSTAEILTERKFTYGEAEGTKLIVLYGDPGTTAEMSLDTSPDCVARARRLGDDFHQHASATPGGICLTFKFHERKTSFAVIQAVRRSHLEQKEEKADADMPDKAGFKKIQEKEEEVEETPLESLLVMICTRDLAGRTWFVGDASRGREVLVCGLDYARVAADQDYKRRKSSETVHVNYEHDVRKKRIDVVTVSPQPCQMEGFEAISDYNHLTYATWFRKKSNHEIPIVEPDLLRDNVKTIMDNKEATVGFDDRKWTRAYDEKTQGPKSLDDLDIHEGHAWYRAEVKLTEEEINECASQFLYIKHANDIVGIYVNGTYITTLAPLGNSIDSSNKKCGGGKDMEERIRNSLSAGINVVAFIVEIWGHGAFEMPTGGLFATSLSLPAVSPRGKKGLFGKATVCGVPLSTWRVRAKLSGEAKIESRDRLARSLTSSSAESSLCFGLSKEKMEDLPPEDENEDLDDKAPLKINLKRGNVIWVQTVFHSSDLPDPAEYNAPIMLRLKGKNCSATVFLNGNPTPIGRWLSDDEWLKRGTWANSTREMWSYTNPDHIPVPTRALRRTKSKSYGDQNVLHIVLKDTSGSEENAETGHVEISLVLNDDDLSTPAAVDMKLKREDSNIDSKIKYMPPRIAAEQKAAFEEKEKLSELLMSQ
eukprot:CAMPEP_0167751810 /NCGR_PEP_ID=MMETSP0110_2-20121227/6786_1 /TAXON_ID=629695 /ORGANISM="Gymnochlora sp., Strain CCMP2014" /LENGTH=1268 /DNA_ID=CAMNT_0007637349 /DNA_START=107 /DNA_END=3914 /DNA_ORIENTATION=-